MQPGDDEQAERNVEEIIDFFAEICQPIFREFAHITPPQHRTLYNSLYLQILQLRLETLNSKAMMRIEGGPQTLQPSSYHCRGLNLPTFKPSKIKVWETLKDNTVFKTFVDGSIKCAKVIGYQYSTKSMQREIGILQRISEASRIHRIRVPALLGVILSEDDPDLVLGFLTEYIKPSPLARDLLSCIEATPTETRLAWAEEITATLARLHGLGVVWGDAKAGNIILDEDNYPWLIDFGGGYTNGWVDADQAESVTGDLQGLQRILKHLILRRCRYH